MYEVIYFVKPFNAFIGYVGTILFFFLIGGLGVLSGLLGRKERIAIRVIMLLVGGLLVLVGVVMSLQVIQEYIAGAAPFTEQFGS